ncbi:MAG: SBBP repeat-containing protein, partial [Actinobacteria bacterium]|nr:SBBP repeat-containing protein [Actinomycetota bacterium]
PLVIDPLVYSTFLGGPSSDNIYGVGVDRGGNIVVAGRTRPGNGDFPQKNAVDGRGEDRDKDDAFVTKFDATTGYSTLVYSTYLSSPKNDQAYALAVDRDGNAYVTGGAAQGFITTPTARVKDCLDPIEDVFVSKLGPSGSLVFSTCLGGSDRERGMGIAVDAGGNVHVTGWTLSADFPTTGTIQPSRNGVEWDAFVTKLNPSGSALVYSTYLGGTNREWGMSIALDTAGAAYVAGGTTSTDFPLAGTPVQAVNKGGLDLYVAKLKPDGSGLTYSTYLGGSGYDGSTMVGPNVALAVDGAGRAHVAAGTTSQDFPMAGTPFRATYVGGEADVVVAKLNPSGSALVYATYLGGTGEEPVNGDVRLALDGSGAAYVVGATKSIDFPVANPITGGGVLKGLTDAFVTKLDPFGSALVYSTYLGGAAGYGADVGEVVAVDPDGNAYVAGGTTSLDFPTAGTPYQATMNANTADPSNQHDAFLSKFDPWLGFLRVTTNPALPSQVTVDGVPRTTWGTINLEAAPGTHQVCFRDVEGFTKPACQTVTVSNGAATQVAGNFT